ncbi:MAG: site-specific integrase [Bacilli bacterium]|nr:site-specific integrase [Bacilli bacterium]
MQIKKLSKEFLSECEYKNLSEVTIRNYTKVLGKFIDTIEVTNIEDLNKQMVKHYINNLPLVTSSKNQHLRCIMAFINWYQYEYDKNLNIKIHRLKEAHTIKYTPSDDEVKQLLNFYSNKTYMECRNKTIISCFVFLGLRVSELIEIKYDNVDLEHNIITIHRKGNIDQQLPINKDVKLQLTKYMNRYHHDKELLFVSKNGNILNASNIHNILKKVNPKINPHSLRRYCCTKMIKDGIPLIFVSRYMNHSSIEITNSYYADVRAEDVKEYFM